MAIALSLLGKRTLLLDLLRRRGLQVYAGNASLFLWVEVPAGTVWMGSAAADPCRADDEDTRAKLRTLGRYDDALIDTILKHLGDFRSGAAGAQ